MNDPILQQTNQTMALFMFLTIVFIIIAVIIYVVLSYFLSRIFKKAGVKPWKAYIPVYNTILILQLGNKSVYWIIPILVSQVLYQISNALDRANSPDLFEEPTTLSLYFTLASLGVGIFGVVAQIMAYYHIGRKLGKSGAFVLWAIFFYPVWVIWLAIDKSKWDETESGTLSGNGDDVQLVPAGPAGGTTESSPTLGESVNPDQHPRT